MSIHAKGTQRGFSLTEALIAFVVVLSGLLGVASFQVGLFNSSSFNKARTEAMALAQQKLEQFKHYTLSAEDAYIDNNSDGTMDADGTYTDNTITGQNADFTRSWDLATGADGKNIDVTVAWTDSESITNTVTLASTIPWLSPRSGADQLADPMDPIIPSPTGRARLGDGNLADYGVNDYTQIDGPGGDGMSTYQLDDDLLLVDPNDNIVLTLEDACETDSGICTDFAKIAGTVYVDENNTNTDAEDISVISSDAAYCERWVPTGTLSNPPKTASNDYSYYNYICYFGGGWHGNIGFIKSGGLQQTDKVCMGDPTSLNSWEQPVIALRRAYRGMISRDISGQTFYYSHGLKDAITLTGHDYVFTSLQASVTEGSACTGSGAPMSQTDSNGGMLFADVPTDFFCLNTDDDGDSQPDYLDGYDTSTYSADVYCPYDPTDPPVSSHVISGTITIFSNQTLDLSAFEVVTSDGPGNCVYAFTQGATSYAGAYKCQVFDWGNGWSGTVQVDPNSNDIFCDVPVVSYTDLTGDTSSNYSCESTNTITISGTIGFTGNNLDFYSVALTDINEGTAANCFVSADTTAYECVLPYEGASVDVEMSVSTPDYWCEGPGGTLSSYGLSIDGSPYTQNITIARGSNKCP